MCITSGTVEEKIYQRQLMKGDLAGNVNSINEKLTASFTQEELRQLFTLRTDTASDTRDLMISGEQAEAWQVLGLL